MSTHAIQRAYTGLVSRDQWTTMREQAGILVQTGFLPQHIKTAEQAVAIMLKGYELGIPPMHALNNIAVIGGKPVANAELMLALIYRDHGDDAIRFQETEATHCTISYKRRTWTSRELFTFSMEDARRAALSGTNWTKYPGAMLRARCISAVARLAFPDSIGGMYSPEEMGAAVEVNPETGEIVTVESTAVEIPSESRVASQGAQPPKPLESLSRAATGNQDDTDPLRKAWADFRYIAPQAGFTTEESQKHFIQEYYPDCKPKELTAAEVQAMTLYLRRDVLDLPANDGGEAA